MAATTHPPTAARGRTPGAVLGARCLVVLGIGGLALTQPLLGLFGENPEFFVYARATDADLVAFAVVIALLLPLAAVVLEVLAWLPGRRRLDAAVHHVLVAALAGLYGLVLARQLAPDSDVAAFGSMLAFAALIAVLEARVDVVHRLLRYLALGPLLFAALFLAASPVGRLLSEGEAEAVAVDIGSPHPVIVVMVDELPLSSMIRPDGTIDETRFPGFAALAERTVWYRNAASNAPGTTLSMPSMLSGVLSGIDAIPTSIDHPRNLFTLLGATYDLEVREEVTALCPSSLCGTDDTAGTTEGLSELVAPRADEPVGLGSMLQDAWVVGRHLAYPPSLRDDLPSLDASWGGFLGQDLAPAAGADGAEEGPDPVADFLAQAPEGRAALSQGARLADFAARVEQRPDPTLWFTHAVLPHQPWELTNTGRRYSLSAELVGMENGVWADDPRTVLQGFQRHLLQAGYADKLIADVVASLDAAGLWDDAVVIVAADHGVAFGPEQILRKPVDATAEELYRVPLFVHVPGGPAGVVDDRDAMLMDVLPTIVDALDIDVRWRFDGRSLLQRATPRRARPVRYPQGPTEVSQGLDGVLGLAARNERWLGGEGWRGVYAAGPLGAHVGSAADELGAEPRPERWELDQTQILADLDLDTGFVPAMLTGSTGGAPPPDGWFLVAVNGVAGGSGFAGADGQWYALVDESLFVQGANSVQLLVPDGDEGWWSPALPAVGAQTATIEGGADGVVVLPSGRRIPVVRHDGIQNTVGIDRAVLDGGVLAISGWSLDLEDATVPDQVLLVVNGVRRPVSERRPARHDLANQHGNEGFVRAGFELVATGLRDSVDVAVVAVYADHAIWRPVPLDAGGPATTGP